LDLINHIWIDCQGGKISAGASGRSFIGVQKEIHVTISLGLRLEFFACFLSTFRKVYCSSFPLAVIERQ
jgi:hypothetical protein